MNKSFLTLLLPALLVLSACQKTADAPAPEPAAPAATTTPAETAPVATTEAPAANPANDPAPNANAASGLVAGTDYAVIAGGQPLIPDGKVEVAEVFAYWCGHCAAFEPTVSAWSKKLPSNVRFQPIPLSGGQNDNMAKVYYGAESTGQLAKVHDTMFNAIHQERALAPGATGEEVLAYLAKKGVDTKAMGDAMNSFAMNARLAQALQFADRSGVTGTPTIVVNGKYRVIGKSFEDILRITDALVSQERALLAAPAAAPAAPAPAATPAK